MFGRHGEAPVPIVAPSTPGDCFFAAIEAARIALKYRTPVFLLSDGYLANGAEPWRIPDVAVLPDISVPFATEPNHTNAAGEPEFWPYLRDPVTLARPWAIPGTTGLTHRIGGLGEGGRLGRRLLRPGQPRADDQAPGGQGGRDRRRHPPRRGRRSRTVREVLVLGWGSTYGAIQAGIRRVRAQGHPVAHAHLRHLNPFPSNLGEVLRSYRKVLVPEMNLGQLVKLVRAEFLVDARSLTKPKGKPFQAEEIERAIFDLLLDR